MKLGKLSLFAMAVAAMVVVSCGTPTTSTTGTVATTAGTIRVIVDFSGVAGPADLGLVPFMMGDMDYVDGASGSFDVDATTNGGITAAGTGPQVLTLLSNDVYYMDYSMPDSMDYTVQFKPCNYDPTGWSEIATHLWANAGQVSTGMGNYGMSVSNYVVSAAALTADGALTTNVTGFTVSTDGKTVVCDVAAISGWTLHLPGVTTADFVLTIVWENVPDFKAAGANGFWLPLLGQTTTSNASGEYDTTNTVVNRIAGSRAYLATNASSMWAPAVGHELTVDATAKTLTTSFTVPAGSPRTLEFKATGSAWAYSEAGANHAGSLALTGNQTITVDFSD